MMAAVMQSFPSPTSTLTMLQTRSSSSEPFQTGSQGQQHQRNQVPRNIYNTSVGGMGAGSYRGHTATSPVAPYAFTSTPIMANGQNPLRQHPTAPRLENRTASAPSVPLSLQAQQQNSVSSRPRPPQVNPTSTPLGGSNLYPNQPQTSRNEPSTSSFPSTQSNFRPQPTSDLNPPSLQAASYATVAKSSPDRYRRNHHRAQTSGGLTSIPSAQGGSAMPSGSGMATVGHLYQHPAQSSSSPSLTSYPSYRGAQSPSLPGVNDYSQPRHSSKDDLNLQREREKQSDLAKRYRRRSISSLEAKDYAMLNSEPQPSGQPKTYAAMLAGPAPQLQHQRPVQTTQAMERPTSAHGRNGSNESSASGRSSSKPPSTKPSTVRSPPLICHHLHFSFSTHGFMRVSMVRDSKSKADIRLLGQAIRDILPGSHGTRSNPCSKKRGQACQYSCPWIIGGEQEIGKPFASVEAHGHEPRHEQPKGFIRCSGTIPACSTCHVTRLTQPRWNTGEPCRPTSGRPQ